MTRALLVPLALVVSCGRRDAPADTRTTSAPISSASASSLPDAAAPLPSALLRFSAEVDAHCPRDEKDGSTAGMAQGEVERANCIAQIIRADAAVLPPDQLAILLDGTRESPRGQSRDPVGSTWSTTTDAMCRVEGFEEWTDEGWQRMGTYERIRSVACLGDVDLAFAFEARCRREGRAADFAAYVEARSRGRPDPALAMARWARYAKLARRTAPLAALPCEGLDCRRTDVEWIGLERDLESIEKGTTKLARGLCATWTELAAAFGGEEPCRARMTAHWLPAAAEMGGGWIVPPSADAMAQPADKDLPPPADDAHDAAIYAARRGCPDGDEEACAEREHAAATSSARAPILAWDAHLGAFRDRLCGLDEPARFLSFSPSPKPWLAPPARRGGCRATGLLLSARVLRLLDAGDHDGLEKHLRAREAWGEAVERGLGAVKDHFRKPCQKASPADCAAAIRRLDAARADAAALGAELCRATPDLAKALGEPRCPVAVARYALSFATYLGKPDLLKP